MTPQQLSVLDALRVRIDAGFTPSLDELGRAVGRSKTAVFKTIGELEQAGVIGRRPGKSRSLTITGRPDLRLASTEAMEAELARRGRSFRALSGSVSYAPRGSVTCAADCCQQRVRRGHLFCRDHWFALPGDLREQILATFGAKDVPGYEQAVTEARDRLDGSYYQRRDVEMRA